MDKQEAIQLLKDIKQSDRDAFGRLFHVYFQPLVRFAFQYVKQEQDAEDLVSAFFVNLWHKREALPEAIASVQAYLYTSVKNVCLNYLRKSGKKRIAYFDRADTVIFTGSGPEQKELQSMLADAINNLPEQRRIIFRLIKEDGLKSPQVAAILNISVRTVENQLYKAVDSLADKVSKVLGYNPKARKRKSGPWLVQLFF